MLLVINKCISIGLNMIPILNHDENIQNNYIAYLKALSLTSYTGGIAKNYASRLAMSTDNSVYQCLPQALLFPKSIQDVVVISELCQRSEFSTIKFSPRGGGTGTNGQSLTQGLVVDLSKHMHKILDLNINEGWVRVQTGVIKDQLNAYLLPYGYFFSPELSTSNRATLGGMISCDASGQGSMRYGKTSDHVLGLKSVLVSGEILESEPIKGEALKIACARQDNVGVIYRQVLATCTIKEAQIEKKFPQLNRFLTGYDLKHVYDPQQKEVDLSRILCGSEGSLAFICEAKLHIQKIPVYRTLINIKYDSFQSALKNAPFLVAADALSVETVDATILNLAKQDIIWQSIKHLLSSVPNKVVDALNIVEFSEDNAHVQQRKVTDLCDALDKLLVDEKEGVIGYQVCTQLSDINKIYAMRKKAVGLLGKSALSAKPIPFAEDTCVPPEHLASYIMEYRQLLDDKGLHYGMFGHVDAGVLHVRPALDLCLPEQEALMHEISDKVVALTGKYKGLMWGEHGKGFRSEYGPDYFGNELFLELRKIKTSFDPLNHINPGKICTPLNSDDKLVRVDARKRAYYDRQIPIKVRQSYTGALDCNGNGLCFNYSTTSTMCPSVKITRDRVHSPKGRAGLMREWLRQLANHHVDILQVEQELLVDKKTNIFKKLKNTLAKQRGEYDFSHEVMQAMQGCLACKACNTQCPIEVDVSTFRARFMFIYHGRYLRPPQDYLVAYVELYAPLMGMWPRFFNFFTELPVSISCTEKILGMVDVPSLSSPPLQALLKNMHDTHFDLQKLEALSWDERARHVLIVQDPFTSYYDAQVVHDVILCIKKLGYQPILLPFKPNGKAQHIKGFLDKFAKTAQSAAYFLNALSRLNIPMLGTDPAMVLCYRDEYKSILEDKRGDFTVLMFQEWLKHNLKGLMKAPTGQQFYLFGHCTEKTAEPIFASDWTSIFEHYGAKLDEVAVGCCGMAGTFGHDVSKVQQSKAIYSLSWESALKKRTRSACLATGYSCRSQVKRIEGEVLQHPVQALLHLL